MYCTIRLTGCIGVPGTFRGITANRAKHSLAGVLIIAFLLPGATVCSAPVPAKDQGESFRLVPRQGHSWDNHSGYVQPGEELWR